MDATCTALVWTCSLCLRVGSSTFVNPFLGGSPIPSPLLSRRRRLAAAKDTSPSQSAPCHLSVSFACHEPRCLASFVRRAPLTDSQAMARHGHQGVTRSSATETSQAGSSQSQRMNAATASGAAVHVEMCNTRNTWLVPGPRHESLILCALWST